MLRFPFFVVATVLLSACEIADDLAGLEEDDHSDTEQIDVSGVWTATLDGTVIHGEDGTGQTTIITLTLAQSGTEVTGTGAFTDTLDRSRSNEPSGTLVDNILSVTLADFNQQCGGRMVTYTATVTSTTSGSTMSINSSASAMSVCPALSGTLTYTKQ